MENKHFTSNKVFRKFYTIGEEIMNAVTHGVGALLAIAGLVLNIVFGALSADAAKLAGGLVYGIMLVILFTASTLYHALTHPTAKAVFRVLDHTSIFLLIAGTYTPITLVTLRGPVGWTIFGVVWACAVIGIVLNAISIERFKVFSMICYVAMGWCVIFAFPPLFRAMPLPGLVLLIAGGVCYTGGIVFYALRRRYMHGIWHLFVLAGAVCHYLAVLLYVIR